MLLWWDWTLILLVPAFLLGIYAQAKVSSTFKRYSRIASSRGLTGKEVARLVLDGDGLYHVGVEVGGGRLSDHYDPRTRKLSLSPDVANSNSLAAVGVAAHEAGHALQHAQGYAPFKLRGALVPVATVGSNLGIIIFLIGLIFGASQGIPWLMNIGILLFSAAVLFSVVTLPVEFNASRRAIRQLENKGVLVGSELAGAKKVLSAAALTYVAAALMAVLTLLRLILISRR